MAANDSLRDAPTHSVLNSSFPVLLPEDAALFMSDHEFQALIQQQLRRADLKDLEKEITAIDESESKSAETKTKSPFIEGLERHAAHHQTAADLAAKNKAFTQNADVTNISSTNPLVDLFYDLGEQTGTGELESLLDKAWKQDSLLTLKLIFNARSIHLGKSNRVATYKALGWLAENHPLTFLTNLKWLVRPVIEKKPAKPAELEKVKDDDDDFDMVDAAEADPAKAHDTRYGMSHGYWKDLLNLVVFAANDELKVDADPAKILNQIPNKTAAGKRRREWDEQRAKEIRLRKKEEQNRRVQDKMKNDPFYRSLHITVARLFAAQLKEDKALLDSGKKSDLKRLSLAAKWAPTFGEFHDKHTFVLSSIAEILFPEPVLYCPDGGSRELYLRKIRELYRKQYASPLRKALNIVERDIASQTFENIKYDRVPSLALDRYSNLFLQKDTERFTSYVQNVADGNAQISGATLLPSTLVSKARIPKWRGGLPRAGLKGFNAAKAATESKILDSILDGQWNTLVKRVRDAGTLTSSLAVCDVSGSMDSPTFKDNSRPMDSAIGLSLLIAEITTPPFGNGFITFSSRPEYISLSTTGASSAPNGLVEKVRYIESSPWGGSTNFVAVFEDVILPMALTNKIAPKDMIKQLFVFSDMQFDSAQHASERWDSSYERIKLLYAEAGYEMPRLVFWNLASYSTSKPTVMGDLDTALVSGYSQGMLRAFLEGGAFEEGEDVGEEEVEIEGDEEGGMVEIKMVKRKMDPLTVVTKAVANKAYAMLDVVD